MGQGPSYRVHIENTHEIRELVCDEEDVFEVDVYFDRTTPDAGRTALVWYLCF